MHWYQPFRAFASSVGAKTTNFFRIFTSSLSGTSAFVSFPLLLLVLGGMATTGKGKAEDELSMRSFEQKRRKGSPWIREEEDDGRLQIEKEGGKVNRPRLHSFPFYGEGARLPFLLPKVNTPLQARCGRNRSAHAHHIPHLMRMMEDTVSRSLQSGYSPAT